jgi:hypothetical protein
MNSEWVLFGNRRSELLKHLSHRKKTAQGSTECEKTGCCRR